MLLNVSQVSHSFGPSLVLDDISFHLNPGERAGIVGANGSGKTTLLRIIAGELDPSAGMATVQRGVVTGYLPQRAPQVPPGTTVDDLIYHSLGDLRRIEERLRELEAAMADPQADFEAVSEEYADLSQRFEARGGYDLDHRIEIVLAGLGLGHLGREREFATLSGGEAMRVMLATLLLLAPDLLLLDEPTNHLDFASIEWLGDYLAAYRGGIVAVSHDRHFLNRSVTRILAIDEHDHRLRSYPGNYDDYRAVREREIADYEAAYAAQQIEINELRKAIRSTIASLDRKAPPRRDADKSLYNAQGQRAEQTAGKTIGWMRERLRRVEADALPRPPERIGIRTELGGDALLSNEIVRLRGVSKSYGGAPVLAGVDFTLRRGETAVIVGPNGAGKTTLIEIITGLRAPDAGEVVLAPAARVAFLDQHARALPEEQTVLEVYREGLVEYEHHLISDLLRHGLFRLDDLDKKVCELSLGQRRKLQIARLLVAEYNLLVIDEPTNHLSLDVLDEFERALRAFPGPVIAVSHDRWFIEHSGGRVWELRDGRLIEHYDEPERVIAAIHPEAVGSR
jgi:macrolide transport system ATP-binding/permease protein